MVKNFLQPKVSEIINNFLKEGEKNYKDLRNNLSRYKNIFHYVYSNVFPEIYCSTENKAPISKAISTLFLKPTKVRKTWRLL